jgi:putative oxidoreductase
VDPEFGAGSELPVVWSIMLVVQALLGDWPYALVPSSAARMQLKGA